MIKEKSISLHKNGKFPVSDSYVLIRQLRIGRERAVERPHLWEYERKK